MKPQQEFNYFDMKDRNAKTIKNHKTIFWYAYITFSLSVLVFVGLVVYKETQKVIQDWVVILPLFVGCPLAFILFVWPYVINKFKN